MLNDPLTFVVPGEAIGKARARAVVTGFKRCANGKVRPRIRHYTPEKTRSWEDAVAMIARSAMRGRKPFDGPVRIDYVATFVPPESWPRWKRDLALAGHVHHTMKPDRDNIDKALCDALNGIVWLDDTYAVGGGQRKLYGPEAQLSVCVTPLVGFPAQITKKPHR